MVAKKYAVAAGVGMILIIFIVNLAGWSFYALCKNVVSDMLVSNFGVVDENQQLMIITLVFMAGAVGIALLTGIPLAKVLNDFIR